MEISNLRSVFTGDSLQHEGILREGTTFLKSNDPGVFIVGGTNLTGKSTLVRQIFDQSGLEEYYYGKPEEGKRYFARPSYFFVDENGKPAHDFDRFEQTLAESLKHGIKLFYLDEIPALHREALELVRDKLVRECGCRVVFDVISSNQGKGFYDSEANNRFITEQMETIFDPTELHLRTLTFNSDRLIEGLEEIALYNPDYFFGQVDAYFPEDSADKINSCFIELQGKRIELEEFRQNLEDMVKISHGSPENKERDL